MPERAQVTSVDAIDSFRASLLTYLASARPTVDEIGSEVLRLRTWLEQDRQRHWEREVVRRTRLLREAEAALFSARMSQLQEVTDAQMVAVRRSKAALEEAEDRLRRVKKWMREFDSRIEPLGRQLDSLRNHFTIDLPRAAASLHQTMERLNEYAGVTVAAAPPPTGAEPSAPPTGGGT